MKKAEVKFENITKKFNETTAVNTHSAYSTLYKFNSHCFFFTHDACSTFLPLLAETVSGDSIALSALMVALTTFTGLVDP